MLIQLTIFIVGLLGAALLSYGAWLVYPPAGLLNGDKVRIVPGTRGYNIPVYPPATTGLLAPSAVVPASASALQGDAPPMSGPGLRHGHLSGPPGHGPHDGPRDNVRAMPEERFVPEAGGQR